MMARAMPALRMRAHVHRARILRNECRSFKVKAYGYGKRDAEYEFRDAGDEMRDASSEMRDS